VSELIEFSNKKIYIAGAMTGIKDFNFPSFDDARDWIVQCGGVAINPADIDRAFGFEGIGMSGDHSELGWSKSKLGDVIARDIKALSECDAIYLLEGWESSKGANIELAFALMIDLEVFYQKS